MASIVFRCPHCAGTFPVESRPSQQQVNCTHCRGLVTIPAMAVGAPVGKAGGPNAIPMIARNGTNNGCWAHSGQLWWANEDTHLLKNHVDRRSYKSLLEVK